jgi:DNA-binding protein H-NS
MVTRAKRSIEDRIADTQAKLKLLQSEKKKLEQTKAKKLTRASAGMAELLKQIDSVAKHNNVKAADVIKLAAKLKRTGLVIEHKSTRFDEVMSL